MKFKIIRPSGTIDTSILLPASKSISNRLLIIRALAGSSTSISNLSDSDDTRFMLKSLSSESPVKDVGHAGTTMRFLTAFYSVRPGKVVLTGSERMQERPIGPLVDALRELGAGITYTGREGFPPLEISGTSMEGGELGIESGISSQFISALLMVAPLMKQGLRLQLKGEQVSSSYIDMTLGLMREAGATCERDEHAITVYPGRYVFRDLTVESDWSAASYWYGMSLLEEQAQLSLKFLKKESYQGDSVLVSLFQQLGVITEFEDDGPIVKRLSRSTPAMFSYDFTDSPDIVQTLAVALCLSNIPFHFSGTRTLRIKETDRIKALQIELGKYGYVLRTDEKGTFLAWNREYHEEEEKNPVIETYHDHRMAMSFAMMSLKKGSVTIEDPMVVTKSYPGFWEDLKKAGFTIEELD